MMSPVNRYIRQHVDLMVLFAWGAVSLAAIHLSLQYTGSAFTILRWVLCLPYVYLLCGYPLALVLAPPRKDIRLGERLLLSAGLSLVLLYPAGFINCLLEGREGAYRIHLPGFFVTLFALSVAGTVWALAIRSRRSERFTLPSFGKIKSFSFLCLLAIILMSAFLNFYNLGRADLQGDEINMGFRNYDLEDGAVVGRKAFCLSFRNHPPLANYIFHATSQILSPWGFYTLSDWMFRVAPASVGLLTVLAVYMLGVRFFGRREGVLATFLISISNYNVWINRFYIKDGFLTLFMCAALLFFYRAMEEKNRRCRESYQLVAGIFVGATLLVKTVGFLIVIPLLVMAFSLRRGGWIRPAIVVLLVAVLVYSPVIVYNIAAYLKTGYMDVAWAKICKPLGLKVESYMSKGAEPGSMYAQIQNPLEEFSKIFYVLADLYSSPLFAMFILGFLLSFVQGHGKFNSRLGLQVWLIGSLVFFAFNGIREYYMPFLTVAFSLLAADSAIRFYNAISERSCLKRASASVLIILGLYSLQYTFRSNHIPLFGRSAEPRFRFISFSSITRVWANEYGCKDLRDYVDRNVRENDLLVVDDRLYIQHYRWYIKKFAFMIENGKYMDELPRIGAQPTIVRSSDIDKVKLMGYPRVFLIYCAIGDVPDWLQKAPGEIRTVQVLKDTSGRERYKFELREVKVRS